MVNCKQCSQEISDLKVLVRKSKPRSYCSPCNKKRHIEAVKKYQARKEAVNME